MIVTSQAYKDAIKNGNSQRVFIDMGDVILTNEDISVTSGGLKFEDRFNEETELTFGATPSNSISVALINRDGFFDDYDFGKISASVGVMVSSSRYNRSGSVTVEIGKNGKRFVGQTIVPYLLEDGVACSIQPEFAVRSIVVDNGLVYCFGASSDDVMAFKMNAWNGLPEWSDLESYDWSYFDGSYTKIDVPVFNSHTREKINGLIRDHKGIVIHGNVVADYLHSNRQNVYEYVKLGTFFAESDGILRKSIISLDADDQMVLFDDILIDEVGLSFPITLLGMVKTICQYVGVEFVNKDFINSDFVVESRPDDFDETTVREVLRWIAEAACSYAKFDRDGNLCLKWFERTDNRFNERTFASFDPMVYEVEQISGLKIRNANSDEEQTYGSGNTYLIQGNPFLRPDDSVSTFSMRRNASNPILDKASSLESFYPSSGTLFGDFSVESGDVITVTKDGRDYSVPIYSASTSWNGSSITNIENSGSKRRTIPSLKQREEYTQERYNYTTSKAIGGLGGRTSSLEESMAYARIDIDEQKGKILLIAGATDLNEIDGSQTIKQAYIDIDGANANITLNASAIDGVSGRVSSAEIEIDGLNSEIILKADKTYVDNLVANSIEAAISDIELSISDTIATKNLTVADKLNVSYQFTFGGSYVSKTTLPIVTSFTQALGESSPTQQYTLLTSA